MARVVVNERVALRLERAIAGALRATIRDHGPITATRIGSAVKRIVGNLRNVPPEELVAVSLSANAPRPAASSSRSTRGRP